MKKIFKKIEEQNITISQWIIGFIGIMFVRFIFESLSSPTDSGVIPSDPFTLIHYGLFFLTAALGFICIIGYFNKDFLNALKVVLFLWPLVWLAPILDIILSKGKGYLMSYIYDTGQDLFLDFFRFFSPKYLAGATYGIRIEVAILFFLFGLYVWFKRKKLLPAILSVITLTLFLFVIATMPSLMYQISHLKAVVMTTETSYVRIVKYLSELIFKSNILHNTLHEGFSSVPYERFLRLGFDKLMSQILFLISLIFGGILFWKTNQNKFKAVIKNSRPERIVYWLSLLFLGIGYGYLFGNPLNFGVDILSIVCLSIAWASLWIQAVQVNDLADVNIDKISNTNRPMIEKTMTPDEMRDVGNLFLAIALLGSWSVGFYPFFMSLVYVATSYIYSAPPLRLKRVPMLSSFLISIACLATIMAGFFFISIDKNVQTFPIFAAIGILVMFTLEANFRDMKDVEGDRAEGIKTLPVLFGKYGPQVTGLFFALSFLLAPIFLKLFTLYILSIPTAIIGYKLMIKKPYKEKPLFILHFTFLICMSLLVVWLFHLAQIYNL